VPKRQAVRTQSGSDRAHPFSVTAAGRLGYVGRPRAHPCQRIEKAFHRPRAQGCIAVEGRRNRHPATAPMTGGQPVPELPKSSGPAGSAKPATPTPLTRQAPGPVRSTLARAPAWRGRY